MLNTMNEQLFLFIHGGAGYYHLLDAFFLFVTNIWVPLLVVGSLLYFFIALPFRRKNLMDRISAYKLAGLFTISLLFVWVIVEFIKGVVAFPRPAELLENLQTLSVFGSYDSFPSAHTAFAFAVAIFIYHYSKPAGMLVFAMAVFVGISRVFVGVHFPLDVICGALVGMAVPWAII